MGKTIPKYARKLDLFILAGESSGDVLGEELIKEIKRINPSLQIAGICGPRMRAENVFSFLPMEKLHVMGFVDIFLSLPKFFLLFQKVKRLLLLQNPSCIVFIDYPGFNLRMAKALRKAGFHGKIIHYVCPSVWAWGKNRIQKMVNNLDLLLSILPFEKELFENLPLDVRYIGHPLMKKTSTYKYDENWHLLQKRPFLSIFPGSRKGEIIKNLPIQLLAAHKIAAHKNLSLMISVAHLDFYPLIEQIASSLSLPKNSFTLVDGNHRYELMRNSTFAIATSGTVTLELALQCTPTVITYALKKFDQFLAQKIFRINLPFYTLPNIILKKELFPELIGPYFTENNLLKAISRLLHPANEDRCRFECQKIPEILKEKNASEEAAKAILNSFCRD